MTSSATSSSIPAIGACSKGISLLMEDTTIRSKLSQHAHVMRAILGKKGIECIEAAAPILGMNMSSEQEAIRLSEHLYKKDVVIPHMRYASEPRFNILRGVAKSSYTADDLEMFERAVLTF